MFCVWHASNGSLSVKTAVVGKSIFYLQIVLDSSVLKDRIGERFRENQFEIFEILLLLSPNRLRLEANKRPLNNLS